MARHSVPYYLSGIQSGDKIILSQAITLLESTLYDDSILAQSILNQLTTHSDSIRIGITGVPGVGKSTFIEAFGTYLTGLGHKVAVLAVDPSSQKTGGSILGDKTRMETLSKNPKAFIRPSPTKSMLGGVANTTRESILLCEAAGFDIIIIETVGVGQSETAVHGMVDFFLLLMLAGAGDELQGIKKGIMEMADGIVINKADGDNLKQANRAKGECINALHLFTPNESGWQPKVLSCSAIEKRGIDDVWEMISDYRVEMSDNGHIIANRLQQNVENFELQLTQTIMNKAFESTDIEAYRDLLKSNIIKGKMTVREALIKMTDRVF